MIHKTKNLQVFCHSREEQTLKKPKVFFLSDFLCLSFPLLSGPGPLHLAKDTLLPHLHPHERQQNPIGTPGEKKNLGKPRSLGQFLI